MAEIDTKPAASAFDGTERVPVKQGGYKKGTLNQVLTFITSKLNTAKRLVPTPLGTALQVLRTNAGADGIEWADPPSGGGGADVMRVVVMAVATPAASEVLTLFTAPADITFPANFAGSVGKIASGGANPAATFTATVHSDGTQIGTIAVSASGVFTFATASGTSKAVASGACVIIRGPAVADTAIVNFAATLVADID